MLLSECGHCICPNCWEDDAACYECYINEMNEVNVTNISFFSVKKSGVANCSGLFVVKKKEKEKKKKLKLKNFFIKNQFVPRFNPLLPTPFFLGTHRVGLKI